MDNLPVVIPTTLLVAAIFGLFIQRVTISRLKQSRSQLYRENVAMIEYSHSITK